MRPSLTVRRSRVRSRLASERGYSLIESLVTILILGIVVTGLTTTFVSSSHAELDLSRRFQAQEQARVALDKLRRELHCASELSVASAATLTATLPTSCGYSSPQTVMWCVSGSSAPYVLRRIAPSTGACTGGTPWASSLVAATWFSLPPRPAGELATLHVDLPVNVEANATASSARTFRLTDDIALRNFSRP